MPTQRKIETVQKLGENLKKAKSLVLVDYQGLTHKQLEDLRKTLREFGADFSVTKNSLLKRALESTNYKLPTTDYLTGPTAILLTYEENLAPLKEIAKFIRSFQLPTIKVGIWEGKLLSGEDLLSLAQLPTKEVLLGQLTWQLKAPLAELVYVLNGNIQKLVFTLNAVGKTKSV